MFEIAWSEILVIAIVALIVIGPKELPEVLRGFGRGLTKLRRSADEFRRHFEDSVRDTGYEDVRRNLQDIRQLNPAHQIRESIDRALNSPDPASQGNSYSQDSVAGHRLGESGGHGASQAAGQGADSGMTFVDHTASQAQRDGNSQPASAETHGNGTPQAQNEHSFQGSQGIFRTDPGKIRESLGMAETMPKEPSPEDGKPRRALAESAKPAGAITDSTSKSAAAPAYNH
jgi:sec-independent protein translocase protein TatB